MISQTHQRVADYSLVALALLYIIMLGGGNYEQMNVTSVIAKAPPKSLYMLKGEYAFNPIKFWATFRPVTILLFIIALISNWKASSFRRKILIAGFFIDILTTIATFVYFAPETGKIMSAEFTQTVDQQLLQITQRWYTLNYFRLAAFYAVGVMLLLAILSPGQKVKSSTIG